MVSGSPTSLKGMRADLSRSFLFLFVSARFYVSTWIILKSSKVSMPAVSSATQIWVWYHELLQS